MIVAGTGHRPPKLGGYAEHTYESLIYIAKKYLAITSVEKVISGMALGWDQALAQAALELGIPLIAAIPFRSFSYSWPPKSVKRYEELLVDAERIEVICPGYVTNSYQKRNEWMVDNCDMLLALWNGYPRGGTYNCIKYAKSVGREIENLWDDWRYIK